MKALVFYDAFEYVGFKVEAEFIWKKLRGTFMRIDWKLNTEPII